ncbi:peptidase C14, caspase domain-containing protein [Armillaria borealis]|uniref:Peptidase C14, caspase domain-containing protein n=1 Tax=Armillaria borealis TaxID=47425 RepID=A0AA39JQJ5_9AGAR|nr:peptidase C14, caspase domain-containing protein [Armillaria borealis]
MAPPPLDETLAADHSTPLHDLSHRFWAVVIGIDAYPAEKGVLRGCVSDAAKVFGFLTKNLGVPTDHITLLLGTTTTARWSYNRTSGTARITGQPATRTNIIDALLGLSTNSQIQKGDNIIIYFSGHGTAYHCSDNPEYPSGSPASTGTIEALCPMDRKAKGFTLKGRKAIPDISDRELYTILAEISRTKGHHITVILDCCHSSGLTRHPQGKGSEESPLLRSAKPLSASTSIADMFAAADKRLGNFKNGSKPRYESISKGNWTPEIPVKTHVVLAACNAYEYAAEVEAVPTPADNLDSKSERVTYNGYFTVALLATLKSVIRKPASLNDKLPSYFKLVEDLVKKLKEIQPDGSSNQHPVVAGASMHEPLWYTGPNCGINCTESRSVPQGPVTN